jgi:D-beta-D-heptose 7-phosphate kinase/D-beta-D-heptose 1-phosphate adenosyltransferase
MASIIEDFSALKIMVVGDVMLDRYVFGEVNKISPEAPVQVLTVSREEVSPGGAANVANNLKSLGASVEIYGVIGDDPEGEKLLELLQRLEIRSKGIILDPKRPTTTKTRLIAGNQQVIRMDREVTEAIPGQVKDRILEAIIQSLGENPPDGIIISDYAKGLVRRDLSTSIIQMAKEKGIFICIDPKGKDFTRYRGADAITPNQREAEEVCGFQLEGEESLQRAVQILIQQTEAQGVLITRGKNGISYYVREGKELKTISSDAREIYDVTGAGDTVVSTFTLAFIKSKSWEDSVKIANRAAGIVVGRIGAAAVTREELINSYEEKNQATKGKLFEIGMLLTVISKHKAEGKKIVFTNGCFDLFHVGHLALLRQAKELGDVLIVGINSQDSVRRIKGNGRPFIPESERANIVAAIDCVDYVVVFSEDTPLELIRLIKPDVLVKGGDYSPEEVVGRDVVEGYGGRVSIVPLVEGVSTSLLADKIRKRN